MKITIMIFREDSLGIGFHMTIDGQIVTGTCGITVRHAQFMPFILQLEPYEIGGSLTSEDIGTSLRFDLETISNETNIRVALYN